MKALEILFIVSVSVGGLVVAAPGCGGSTSNGVGADASTEGGSSSGSSSGGTTNPNCPTSAPNNQSACMTGDGVCTFGNVICDCGGGANPVWTCTTCPACPATQPTGTCTGAGAGCAALGACTYPGDGGGTTSCNCAAGAAPGMGDTWACGACPTAQPTGACTTEGLDCDYGTTTCGCRRGMGAAGGDTWECETPPPPCPGTQPMAGNTCTAGTGGVAGCPYGAVTCLCRAASGGGDEWSCN